MNRNGEIAENIKTVLQKIERAAAKSGRPAEAVKLIAVTKTIPPELIRAALNSGVTELGENRVQELREKYDSIGEGCNWHLIGHLQTNKVKYIADKVSLIHSLDSLELAREIQKRGEMAGRSIEVLVQVNIAGEETKFGIDKSEAIAFIKRVSGYPSMRVRGLMTIAPLAANAEDVRYVFRELAKLRIDICRENIDNIGMDYLSMGMSGDYEVAIEEGSNMVRIGTAIFGHRQ